jgi:peroxiredoxin
MNLPKYLCVILIGTLIGFAAWPLTARNSVLSKSSELALVNSTGEEILLSSFKGKVVVIEFLFVASPHCIELVQMLDKLGVELKSRGFQPLGVAFGPHADEVMVGHIAGRLKLSYPLGYATSDKVDAYLGREGAEKLKIPQIVVIDRKGIIRATSGSTGNPSIENEAPLRDLVETLLKESARPPSRSAGNTPH